MAAMSAVKRLGAEGIESRAGWIYIGVDRHARCKLSFYLRTASAFCGACMGRRGPILGGALIAMMCRNRTRPCRACLGGARSCQSARGDAKGTQTRRAALSPIRHASTSTLVSLREPKGLRPSLPSSSSSSSPSLGLLSLQVLIFSSLSSSFAPSKLPLSIRPQSLQKRPLSLLL